MKRGLLFLFCCIGFILGFASSRCNINVSLNSVNTTCGNSNGSATVTPTSGTAPFNYLWNNNALTSSISNLSAGIYTVTVTDTIGCSASASTVISPSGSISVTINSTNSTICQGDSAQFCAPCCYVSYSWNSGAVTQCFYAKLSGNYQVTVTDNGNCSAVSNSLLLTAFTSPVAFFHIYPDSLNQGVYIGYDLSSGNTLLNWRWDFGDGYAANIPYPHHTYSQPGHYYVCLTVTDMNGCQSIYCDSSFYVFKTEGGLMSQLNILNPTGVSEISNSETEFQIFPNPATNQLNITTGGIPIKQINIYNITGQLLRETKQPANNSIDIREFANGVYIAEIKTKEATVIRRWVKM